MINSVEKIYNQNSDFCFKVVTDKETLFVPNSEANRHYQAIQEWITDGGTVIDNGGSE